jgi:hypothetical protein
MTKKRTHTRHPKEHDILKAIKRTPAVVGGELADDKKGTGAGARSRAGSKSSRKKK